jgi:hypothetical protein
MEIVSNSATSVILMEEVFVILFRHRVGLQLLGFHCNVQEEALCAKAGCKEFGNMTETA